MGFEHNGLLVTDWMFVRNFIYDNVNPNNDLISGYDWPNHDNNRFETADSDPHGLS